MPCSSPPTSPDVPFCARPPDFTLFCLCAGSHTYNTDHTQVSRRTKPRMNDNHEENIDLCCMDLAQIKHLGRTVAWFKRHPNSFFDLHASLWSNPIYILLLAEINPYILRVVHPSLRRHPTIIQHAFRSCPQLHDIVLPGR